MSCGVWTISAAEVSDVLSNILELDGTGLVAFTVPTNIFDELNIRQAAVVRVPGDAQWSGMHRFHYLPTSLTVVWLFWFCSVLNWTSDVTF